MPFTLFGVSWVFPSSVRETLLGWNGFLMGKRRKIVWRASPLCIFWKIWKTRNKITFEDEVLSIQRLKTSFICQRTTCYPHFFFPYFSPHFFPYFSPQLFPYFFIYYSVQLAYIIWEIIVYMYRARIMREFICFYLLSMYSILVKSIYNIQNSRPRYSAIHTIFWQRWSKMRIKILSKIRVRGRRIVRPESKFQRKKISSCFRRRRF